MEPRSFNRGDEPDQANPGPGDRASMEPRSFNRGDVLRISVTSLLVEQLQWSHGRLTVVTLYLIDVAARGRLCFNGATVV